MDAATEAKSAVEESQREQRKQREENAEHHVTRFFQQSKEGRWIPKFMYVSFRVLHRIRAYSSAYVVYQRIQSRLRRQSRSGSGHHRRSKPCSRDSDQSHIEETYMIRLPVSQHIDSVRISSGR